MQIVDIQRLIDKYKISNREIFNKIGYSESYISRVLGGKDPLTNKFIKAFTNYIKTEYQDNINYSMTEAINQSVNEPQSTHAGTEDTYKVIKLEDKNSELEPTDVLNELLDLKKSGKIDKEFRVKGDSMLPTLFSGDIVATEKVDTNDIISGRVYVVKHSGYCHIKRLYDKTLHDNLIIAKSDNPNIHGIIPIAPNEITELYYVRKKLSHMLPLQHSWESRLVEVEGDVENIRDEINDLMSKISELESKL